MVLVFTLWDILGSAQVGGVIVVLILETKVSSYGLSFHYVFIWSIWGERERRRGGGGEEEDVQMFRFELSMLS